MITGDLYQNKRIDPFGRFCEQGGNMLITNLIYRISFQNEERLSALQGEPVVLLPTHHRLSDILMEGKLLRRTLHKQGNYIMKSSLPVKSLLQWMGGVVIKRAEDLGKLQGRERREAMVAANHVKKHLYQVVVPSLLNQGNPVVFHPEGTRGTHEDDPKTPEKTRRNLGNILKSQKVLMQQVNYVPVDIVYKNKNFFTDVALSVKHPIEVSDDGLDELVEHWEKQVTLEY